MLAILRPIHLFSVLLFCFISWVGTAQAQEIPGIESKQINTPNDWPWWRGPYRDGKSAPVSSDPSKSAATRIPSTFGETENVIWKIAVPGRGHGSPIVVGNKVYLPTADEKKQIHSVLAFDRQTGKMLWKTDVSQGGFPGKNHPKNTEASSTLASDGEFIFATFFHHKTVEVVALDFDGKESWRKTAGAFDPKMFEYGYAPSPIVYNDKIIVAGEYDGESFIVALSRQDGSEIWRIDRPKSISFSSPVVARVNDQVQMLISGNQFVTSYSPDTGKLLWQVTGTTFATCGTMVWDGNIVFASGGFPKAETLAVRADGSKKVLWKNNKKCYEQSMIAYQGHLYALTDNGIAYCWKGDDGKEMWEKRLQGPVSSSPVLIGDRILWANEAGTFYVYKASPEKFELLAENQVGDESFASPAVSGDRLFLRVAVQEDGNRQEYLYCIGSQKP